MFAQIESFIFSLEANTVIKEDLNARIEHFLFHEDRIIPFSKPWRPRWIEQFFITMSDQKHIFFPKTIFLLEEYLNARIENTVKNVHGENFFLELILIK